MGAATEFAKLHKKKEWTPTMGMAIVFISIGLIVGLSVLLQWLSPLLVDWFGWSLRYSLFNRNETYLSLFTLLTVGAIGLVDDYLNIIGYGRTKGLSAKIKMILLSLFAALGAYWFYYKLGFTGISIPFFGVLDLGWLYIPFFALVIVSMANAVNITDGLDGLAGGLLLFNYAVYAFICYNKWLFLLGALCMLIVGWLIAFLWFNIKPARFYMGDVGALALGANLAIVAMMTDTLVVLLIISLVYVLELFSVIIQMISKKLRGGKKIFRIAPFHHHLEAIGWSEETVVMRFWLIGMVLSSIGLVVSMVGGV
jgi:phospho-N-acetylmuramoyl-pentapeptide-transferase